MQFSQKVELKKLDRSVFNFLKPIDLYVLTFIDNNDEFSIIGNEAGICPRALRKSLNKLKKLKFIDYGKKSGSGYNTRKRMKGIVLIDENFKLN